MRLIRRSAGLSLCVFASLAAQSPAELSLAVNAKPDGLTFAGWPVELRATVALKEDVDEYVVRPSAITLAVTDGTGQAVELPFTAVAVASEDTTLNADHDILTLRYVLRPEQTAALSGAYTISLSIEDLKATAPLVVSAEPEEPSGERAAKKRAAFCDFAIATGDFQRALELADEELGENPASLAGMSRKATALEGLGRIDEAIDVLGAGIEAFAAQNPGSTHPPREFQVRYRALVVRMAGGAQ